MDNITIEPLKRERFESQWLALDAVARERKYLIFQQAPPRESSFAFFETMMGASGVMMQAIHHETVIGWCDVRRSEHEISKHCGTLGMGIVDGFRNQGIGQRLMMATLAAIKASRLGIERVELTVWSSNERALRLYERCGFVHEGRKIRARKLDDAYSDVILMAKFL